MTVLVLDPNRERKLQDMDDIIRRMTLVSAGGLLVLADYSERELSIVLLAYLEGRPSDIET